MRVERRAGEIVSSDLGTGIGRPACQDQLAVRRAAARAAVHTRAAARAHSSALEAADEQDRSARLRPGPRAPGGCPGRAKDDPLGCNAKLRDRFTRRVLRDDDDGVGAAGMAGGQRRVVAPDLGGGSGRIVEEEEVVDRDDLGGCAGRHQQRMHRVRDVDGPGQGSTAAARAGARRDSGAAPGPGHRPRQRLARGPARGGPSTSSRRASACRRLAAATASACAISCAYSPTPVRSTSAGR